jgi:hypothetical protein
MHLCEPVAGKQPALILILRHIETKTNFTGAKTSDPVWVSKENCHKI